MNTCTTSLLYEHMYGFDLKDCNVCRALTWQPHAMTLLNEILVQKTHLYLQVQLQLLLSQQQNQLQYLLQHQILKDKVILDLTG